MEGPRIRLLSGNLESALHGYMVVTCLLGTDPVEQGLQAPSIIPNNPLASLAPRAYMGSALS